MSDIVFNFNDRVTVTLTEKGAEVMNLEEASLVQLFPKLAVHAKTWKAGDQWTEQFHEVVSRLGSAMGIGGDPPIRSTVVLHSEATPGASEAALRGAP